MKIVDPHMPLLRQVVWTNHDVALFVAVSFNHGAENHEPYFKELCPQFRKGDVVEMIGVLTSNGAIDNMSFLKYLKDAELDRLLPNWVADDVRKRR